MCLLLSQRTTAPSDLQSICGERFSLENTALFEYDCSCGRHTYGRTNIEDADFSYPCGDCGKATILKWNPKAKKYME